MMLDLPEVLLTEAVERRAVELGRTADEVVDLRLERGPARVVPRVLRDIPVLDKDGVGVPVLDLSA